MDLHGGFCFVGFPLGGSCQRPRPLTDEGQVYGHHPLAGYDIGLPPSFGPARGGRHSYSGSRSFTKSRNAWAAGARFSPQARPISIIWWGFIGRSTTPG